MGVCIHNKGRECRALSVFVCKSKKSKKCSFKQTHDEHFDSVQTANKRLRNIDCSQQRYIADRYYGGDMPWYANGVM